MDVVLATPFARSFRFCVRELEPWFSLSEEKEAWGDGDKEVWVGIEGRVEGRVDDLCGREDRSPSSSEREAYRARRAILGCQQAFDEATISRD